MRLIFEGHVYVKGHFNQPSCRVAGDFTNKTAIRIPFTDCGTTRLRSVSICHLVGWCKKCSGVEISFVSVNSAWDLCGNNSDIQISSSFSCEFSFNSNELDTGILCEYISLKTKIDRAFHIRCFYMGPAEKTISSQLLVRSVTISNASAKSQFELLGFSALSTEMFSETIPMPVCTYNLHLRTPEGPIVKTAAVGDPIYHLWTCDDCLYLLIPTPVEQLSPQCELVFSI